MNSNTASPVRRYYGASPTMTVESYHTLGSTGGRSDSYRRLSGGSASSRLDPKDTVPSQLPTSRYNSQEPAPARSTIPVKRTSYADTFLREEALKAAATSATVASQIEKAALAFSECVQACSFIGMNHSTELLTIYSIAASGIIETMEPRWKRAGLPPPRPPSEKSLLSPTVKNICTPTKGLMSPRPCPQSVSPPHHSPPPMPSEDVVHGLRGAPTPPPQTCSIGATSNLPATAAPPQIESVTSGYTPYAKVLSTPQASLDKVQSSIVRDRVSSLLDAADQSVLKASLERDRERQALASTTTLTGITGVTGVISAYYNDPNLLKRTDYSSGSAHRDVVGTSTLTAAPVVGADSTLPDSLKDVSAISNPPSLHQSYSSAVPDYKESQPLPTTTAAAVPASYPTVLPTATPPHSNVNAVLDQVKQMEQQLGTIKTSLIYHLSGTHSKGTSPPMGAISSQSLRSENP
eukprot:TRINITY_DN33608_c0_g1_i1.p1 TRINITY_DN33608_c0_g1~~TRINITY_DN33608_c0_g1_i1.p1  ORF type:complete len:464 (+),score=79.62 TRINITY_DN33608_c0_g1_i1:131-1522(+)